ncbi:MAG: hypothetical protein HOC77_04925, partial [Chloroflexi bacterium]|nr:hypothetical protein [Chloroflexota bacterium]
DQDRNTEAAAAWDESVEMGQRSRTANGIVLAAQAAMSRSDLEASTGNDAASKDSLQEAINLGRSAGTPAGLDTANAANEKLAKLD